MNVEEIRDFCLSLAGSTECMPFDDETLVFKVGGKMFAFIPLEKTDTFINLKCDPEYSAELREKYNSIQPGYHMNKHYWNTVFVNDEISEDLLKKMIKHSYDEVVKKLPKSEQSKYR